MSVYMKNRNGTKLMYEDRFMNEFLIVLIALHYL